jgi:hypothetical protein
MWVEGIDLPGSFEKMASVPKSILLAGFRLKRGRACPWWVATLAVSCGPARPRFFAGNYTSLGTPNLAENVEQYLWSVLQFDAILMV